MNAGTIAKGKVLHESVREWQRWRGDMPMRYDKLSEMPMLVAIGFEYLCGKFGRTNEAPHESGHAVMEAEMAARIAIANGQVGVG